MNTNNVYYAKIYRLINIEKYGSNLYNYGKTFKSAFSRDTLVYQKSNGRFYDLLGKKHLNGDFEWSSEIGTEIVSAEHLIPFNTEVNQNKQNLSKRKIKKLYIENKNNK